MSPKTPFRLLAGRTELDTWRPCQIGPAQLIPAPADSTSLGMKIAASLGEEMILDPSSAGPAPYFT
jgi:hypothetical protein